jgi:Flp pilus assembly protein TadD
MVFNLLNAALSLFLAAVFSVSAARRNEVWKSEELLWKDIAVKSFSKARGHTNYGIAIEERGDLDGAEKEFLKAIEVDPSYVDAYGALAIVHGKRGDYQRAEMIFARIVAEFPQDYKTQTGLGVVYLLTGRYEEAEKKFRAALAIKEDYAPARRNLVFFYNLRGEKRLAEEEEKRLSALLRE